MTLQEIATVLARSDALPRAGLDPRHRARRSITFATGVEDRETIVYWVQATASRRHSHSPRTPALLSTTTASTTSISTPWRSCQRRRRLCPHLNALGRPHECGPTGWLPALRQVPEPGFLRRAGDCMIEFPPSNVYVEDWRFQPSAPGLLAGLHLVSETDHKGETRAAQGWPVIAGDHAILTIDRRPPLPDGIKAQDYVRTSSSPKAALAAVFDCTVDYAILHRTTYRIQASTDPRREGAALGITQGFVPTKDPDLLIQNLDDGEIRSRLWRIESLASGAAIPLATQAGAEHLAWLEREADTLLKPLHSKYGTPARCAIINDRPSPGVAVFLAAIPFVALIAAYGIGSYQRLLEKPAGQDPAVSPQMMAAMYEYAFVAREALRRLHLLVRHADQSLAPRRLDGDLGLRCPLCSASSWGSFPMSAPPSAPSSRLFADPAHHRTPHSVHHRGS